MAEEENLKVMYEYEMGHFENPDVPVLVDTTPVLPAAGYKYIFEWNDKSKKNDWRKEGYRFQQNGKTPFLSEALKCFKFHFKLQIEKKKFTTAFQRHAFISPKYPNRVLVFYTGDEKCAVDFPHGNAKRPAKISQPFIPAKPSLIEKMKGAVDQGKFPHELFSHLERESRKESQDPNWNAINAPRDMEQIRNAFKRAKVEKMLPQDSLYMAYQIGYLETDFMTDLSLLPCTTILMHNKG